MAVLIVQWLEAVQVDEDKDQRPTGSFLRLHEIDEGAPVLKTRQWIFCGKSRLLIYEVFEALNRAGNPGGCLVRVMQR